MLTCFDIAHYFLVRQDKDQDQTNLKLQKLVYLAQGFHLAVFDKPLFNEKIEAWEHGPVIPELYHSYKKYETKLIPRPSEFDKNKFAPAIFELLNAIYLHYGQYSAWKLREITHQHEPCLNNTHKTENIISQDELKKYFKKLVTIVKNQNTPEIHRETQNSQLSENMVNELLERYHTAWKTLAQM